MSVKQGDTGRQQQSCPGFPWHGTTQGRKRGRSVLNRDDDKVIRAHPIRHDRSRELGAFANPKGRPRRGNAAS